MQKGKEIEFSQTESLKHERQVFHFSLIQNYGLFEPRQARRNIEPLVLRGLPKNACFLVISIFDLEECVVENKAPI